MVGDFCCMLASWGSSVRESTRGTTDPSGPSGPLYIQTRGSQDQSEMIISFHKYVFIFLGYIDIGELNLFRPQRCF